MIARSALPSDNAVALAVAPSVRIGRSRTKLCSRPNAWLRVWISLTSSLLGGPTAMRRVTGRMAK